MSYTKTNWQDLPNQTTPITATRLNNMENGIANSDGAIGVNEYSTSSTYAIGDYCLHDNKLYRCKTAISTAEAWTSGHWTQVKIVDAIDDTQEGLADATKGYQTSTTAEELEITDSAEANGTLNIDSGKTKQISTTGKNILEPYVSSSTLNGITCIYDAKEQTYTFNGTCNTDNTYFQFGNNEIVFSEGTSSVTFWVSGSVTNYCQIRHYDSGFSSNNNYDIVTLSATNSVISRTRTGTSFTSPANRQTIRFNNGSVATNFKIKIMVTNSTSINVYEPFTGGQPAPSPDYPQDIVSIGDNFNLWGGLTNSYTRVSVGVTFTTNTDGTIDANGTATGTTQSTTFSDANTNGLYVELEAGTYTVSCAEATTGKEIQIIDESSSALGTVINTPIIINLAVRQKIILRLSTKNGTVFKNETFHIKLERGMNATSYSPLNRGSIGFKVKSADKKDADIVWAETGKYLNSSGEINSANGWKYSDYIDISDGDYYIHFESSGNTPKHILYNKDKKMIGYMNVANGNFKIDNNAYYIRLSINTDAQNTLVLYQKRIINVPLPTGIELCKIGNNKDKIVKQDGKWYKYAEISKYVIDGTEDWQLSTSSDNTPVFFIRGVITNYLRNNTNICLCSDYISKDNGNVSVMTNGLCSFRYVSSDSYNDFYIGDNTYSTVVELKTKLAQQYSDGTPVTVYYALATPTYTEITDTDTLEGLYQIEHLLTYEGYTHIECIDEMKPDIHLDYLYNNDVNNTFGGIIAELNARIHALETANE